jgi:Ca-activated chloride channel family protein
VAGRHRSSAANPASSHHGSPTMLLSGGVLLALLVGIGAWATAAGDGCDGRAPLTVHAAPAIMPVIEAVAARLEADQVDASGRCLDVTVLSRDPAAVAARLAGGGELASGPTGDPAGLPDVWVPDSSLWISKIHSTESGRAALAEAGVPIASSTVVIAAARPIAEKLGWSGRDVGWKDVLSTAMEKGALPVGLSDPSRSAAGLASLVSVQRAIGTDSTARAALASTIRALAEHASPGVPELMSRLPVTPSGVGRDTVVAFPADERAVWDYNGQGPAVPLQAIYPSDGSLRLDYPYLVLPGTATDGIRSNASATLLDAVLDARTRSVILATGLRLLDGTGTPDRADERGIRQVAPQAAKAVSLFPDSAEMGIWAFSTDLTAKTDYRELVSIGALSDPVGKVTRRAAIAGAFGALQPKVNGATGCTTRCSPPTAPCAPATRTTW